jgi:hypothetical protein
MEEDIDIPTALKVIGFSLVATAIIVFCVVKLYKKNYSGIAFTLAIVLAITSIIDDMKFQYDLECFLEHEVRYLENKIEIISCFSLKDLLDKYCVCHYRLRTAFNVLLLIVGFAGNILKIPKSSIE